MPPICLVAVRGFDAGHPNPAARVIVVTDYEDEDLRTAALEAGAREYVLKHELSALPDIISSVAGKRGEN